MKSFYTIFVLLICSTTYLLGQSSGELIRPLDFITQLEDVYVDDNGFGWAGGSCGVLLNTINDGLEWKQVESPVEADVLSLACAPTGCQTSLLIIFEGDQVAQSSDNGLSWTLSDLPSSNAFANRMDFFNDDIGLAYSNNDEILRTADGGSTWSILAFESFMSSNLDITSNGTGYFFNGDGKLNKSTDLGASWDTTQYSHPTNVRFLSFWTDNDGYIYDQDRDIYQTNDGGESFTLVNDDTGLPSNLRIFVALDENTIRGVQVTDQVWESDNGGLDWSSYAIDLGDGTFVKRNYHKRGGEFWLVSNMSAIFYAESNFANWSSQIPGERLDAIDMVFIDNNTGFLTDRSGALFKSTDAGASWTLLDQLPTSFNKFYALPNGRLMVTGGALQPRVSDDGGNTFTDLLPTSVTDLYPNEFFNRFAHLPGGRLYFTAGDVAIYSDDNGTTWNEVDLSMLNVNPQNQLYFFDDNLGFIVDNGGGRFARTTDGGLTWEDLTDVSPTTQPLNRIYFTDANNGIAFNSSRAYRTTDGGDTWTTDTSLPGGSDYDFTTSGQLLTVAFASGNNGTTHLSNDNGETWSQFDFVCAPFRGSTITPDNRYFFGFGDGGIVYRYDLDLVNPTRETVNFVPRIKVYPNPTNGVLNVDLSQFNDGNFLVISDLNGRQMLQQQIFSGTTTAHLEVNHLPSGLYILNLYSGAGLVGTQRIVVTP